MKLLGAALRAMQLFERVFFGRKFDRWLEEQTLISARVLNQAAADILRVVDTRIAEAYWRDAYDSGKFVRVKVAPITREVIEPLAIELIDNANMSLCVLVDMKIQWARKIDLEPQESTLFEGAGEMASAVVPLSVGAATAASLPFAAISTTAVMFGFAKVTTISWPIIAAGSAVAALGVATGVIQTNQLWSKAEARMRRRSREFVIRALLKGKPDQPSLLEALHTEFLEAARKAREL